MASDSPLTGKTLHASGSAIAPNGIAFVGITVPPAGWYKIYCKFGFGSVAEASALDNVYLHVNGGAYQGSVLSVPFGVTNVLYEYTFERVWLDGISNVWLAATNASSAGSVYLGALTVTPLQN